MPGRKNLGFSLFFLIVLSLSGQPSVHAATDPSVRAAEIAKQLKTNLKWCEGKIRGLLQYINPREQGVHFIYEKGVAKKVLRGGHELSRMFELFLSPFPMSFIKLPTDSIFISLWNKRGNYEPTEVEWTLLDRYKLRDIFVQKKAFMLKRPTWVKVQRGFVYARRFVLWASIALAFNHGLQAGVPIDRDQYLKDQLYKLEPTQIQILNESVPFPHTAIRMGDKVYSYGFTHLKVTPVSQYLMNKEEFARRYVAEAERADADSSASMTNAAAKQLQKLSRTVQVVTLNLTPEEYASLKRDLELSTGNRYHNVTFVHDCTTMSMKKINKATGIFSCRLFDASPSQTFFYFSALETLGSDRVANVFQVAIDQPASKTGLTLRNLGVSIMESKFFIDLLIYDQPQRLYLDIFKSSSQLEYREPEVQREIDSWKRDVEEEISEDPQWNVFDRIVLGSARLSLDERLEILNQIETYASDKRSALVIERNASETDFKTIILNDFRIQIIDEKIADYRVAMSLH